MKIGIIGCGAIGSVLCKFIDKKLNAKLRIVFILRDIEGNSVKETAKILNLSEANVKVRLMRARMFLKENLEDYYKQRNDNAA